MPVIDLADYLGMPAQAPANPVFNQTRKSTGVASLDREVDDFYKGAAAIDQLYRLQRLAPVFEAQKAQFAYDEIAQKANDLRMKQEIEAQVERAASELAGGNLNPESDDFAVKYRDLATRNPLAFSDQRFSNVAGLYTSQNQAYQAARKQQMDAERANAAKADEELRTAIGSYLEYGGDAALVPSIKSVQQAKYLEGQMRKEARAGTGGKGNTAEERRLKNIWDATEAQLTSIADRATTDDDPKLITAQNERDRALAEWIAFNRSGGVPVVAAQTAEQQVNPSAAAARSALTGMASVATPFSPAALPAMAISGALPQAQAPIQESETIIDINDPSADENTYAAAISDAKTSKEVKQQALEKLRQFAEKPRKLSGLTMRAAQERKNNLTKMVEAAEKQIRLAPEVGKYNQAWDAEKSKVAGWINEFADELGIDADELENSIATKEPISSDAFDADGNLITARDKFEEFLRNKNNGKSPLYDKAEKLNQFKRSEFANELKEGLSPVEKLQTLAAAGLSMALVPFLGGDAASYAAKILPDKSKTYEDVLDIYLDEKVKAVNPAVPATTPENAAKKTNLLKKVGIGANG